MLVSAPEMNIDPPTHLLHLERLPTPTRRQKWPTWGGVAWTLCTTKSLDGVKWGEINLRPAFRATQSG
jgi:hypothetical protein